MDYHGVVSPFIIFVLKVWLVITWIGAFIGLALLPDDFDIAIQKVGKITSSHIVYSMAGLSFLYMAHGLWRELQETLPPSWNPWKKHALKNLTPIIERQLEVGQWLMTPSFSPVEAAHALDLSKFRTALRDLEIEFPNANPGDLPRWDRWMWFLRRLHEYAVKGDIAGARKLSVAMKSQTCHESPRKAS